MSSWKRSVQRRYVKKQLLDKQGNTHGFKEAWEDYRRKELKDENGNVTVVRQKPKRKRQHLDNGKVLLSRMRAFKSLIASMMKKKENKTEE